MRIHESLHTRGEESGNGTQTHLGGALVRMTQTYPCTRQIVSYTESLLAFTQFVFRIESEALYASVSILLDKGTHHPVIRFTHGESRDRYTSRSFHATRSVKQQQQ